MIPEWLPNGDLPPGVHFATWREIETRLSFNLRRRRLMDGLRRACEALRKAGCRLVYLDGSFVTRKKRPGDFDACWDVQNVDDGRLDPVFWDFSHDRAAKAALRRGVPPGATSGGSDGQGVRRLL